MTAPIEIKQRVIEGAPPGPHLLITGGVHGDEFEPMMAIRRLVDIMKADQLHGRVTLVPMVNEPAFLRGDRTADDGLDLARTCPGRRDGPLRDGLNHAQAVESKSQISGLQVPNVVDGDDAILACRASGGTGHLVRDNDVWSIQSRLAREEGIFCEPAAATALTGALRALEVSVP